MEDLHLPTTARPRSWPASARCRGAAWWPSSGLRRGQVDPRRALLRFWEYRRGTIWIGERELRSWPRGDVHLVAVVAQDAPVQPTVRENLLWHGPAPRAGMIEAARQARIHDRSRRCPGAMTPGSASRAAPSAGQRQLSPGHPRTPLSPPRQATANLDAWPAGCWAASAPGRIFTCCSPSPGRPGGCPRIWCWTGARRPARDPPAWCRPTVPTSACGGSEQRDRLAGVRLPQLICCTAASSRVCSFS